MNAGAFAKVANEQRSALVRFAQALVRTPSLPGHEAEVARLVEGEMRSLGYDEVRVDRVGSVVGRIRGRGHGPTVMLNGHMDHVDPGPAEAWEHPPYEGVISGGRLHGRGAADMKASLAAQIYAAGALRRSGQTPDGDVVVAAVVHEETGGLGTQTLLADGIKADYAVVGEASHLELRRGHRGRLEVLITVDGRSVHASVPENGANPHFAVASFVSAMRQVPLTRDADFGGSSVAPTLIMSDNVAGNVTPSRLVLHLDYRTVPAEREADVVATWQEVLDQVMADGCTGNVTIERRTMGAYTGVAETLPNIFPAYCLEATDPLVRRAAGALAAEFGQEPVVGLWRFSTDGGHLMRAGIPTVGFGPGEEALVHTVRESIDLDELVQGMAGYMALCHGLGRPEDAL